jgi:uncharacterized protein YecE (DUF72 family)
VGEPVRIGCSGWQYRHWRGNFYPDELPQSRWFQHYATRFDTVELNNPFYRLPDAETFSRWRRAAPPRFLFAVKASRYLTHMKKLKDPIDSEKREVLHDAHQFEDLSRRSLPCDSPARADGETTPESGPS